MKFFITLFLVIALLFASIGIALSMLLNLCKKEKKEKELLYNYY